MNLSNTLVKNGVRKITLRSLSLFGLGTFWIGVPYSIFHSASQSATPCVEEASIKLYRCVKGVASSGVNSMTSLLAGPRGHQILSYWLLGFVYKHHILLMLVHWVE